MPDKVIRMSDETLEELLGYYAELNESEVEFFAETGQTLSRSITSRRIGTVMATPGSMPRYSKGPMLKEVIQ